MSDSEIEVEQVDDRTFEVTVAGRTETSHTVTVEPKYRRKLVGEGTSAAELVEASFEFLLDREPNTSILSRFELPDITTYFPEYEDKIAEYV